MTEKAWRSLRPAWPPKKASLPEWCNSISRVRNSRRKSLPKDPDRQEEGGASNPARAVVRNAPAGTIIWIWDDASWPNPGVEHGGDADAGAQVAGISGDRHHCLRGSPNSRS